MCAKQHNMFSHLSGGHEKISIHLCGAITRTKKEVPPPHKEQEMRAFVFSALWMQISSSEGEKTLHAAEKGKKKSGKRKMKL